MFKSGTDLLWLLNSRSLQQRRFLLFHPFFPPPRHKTSNPGDYNHPQYHKHHPPITPTFHLDAPPVLHFVLFLAYTATVGTAVFAPLKHRRTFSTVIHDQTVALLTGETDIGGVAKSAALENGWAETAGVVGVENPLVVSVHAFCAVCGCFACLTILNKSRTFYTVPFNGGIAWDAGQTRRVISAHFTPLKHRSAGRTSILPYQIPLLTAVTHNPAAFQLASHTIISGVIAAHAAVVFFWVELVCWATGAFLRAREALEALGGAVQAADRLDVIELVFKAEFVYLERERALVGVHRLTTADNYDGAIGSFMFPVENFIHFEIVVFSGVLLGSQVIKVPASEGLNGNVVGFYNDIIALVVNRVIVYFTYRWKRSNCGVQ